ncbi:glycosyltransferase family 2 protein [Falsiroseomonas sp.]|uniref:glycosyltransferase family 2 protein n=1 Tax=Falsiroseomonas sp. TaxID=2870721 RepID=UPI003564EE83
MIEVVIPAHNAAAYLRETLESIAAQTRPPARVTVVDDRSTDGTPALVEAAARELAPRVEIRLLPNAGPPGPAAARNTAIRAATAQWIALCDADDLLLPEHHAALAAIVGTPGTVLGFGDCSLFESDGGEVLVPSHHAKSGLPALPSRPAAAGGRTLEGTDFAAMLRGPRIATSACLIRREAVLAAGLFDEAMRFAEDYDLFLRLAWLGRFAFTTMQVARKRVHAANLSQERNRARFSLGNLRSAVKLRGIARAADPAPFRPGPEDRALCEAMAPRFAETALYDASRGGFAAYAVAARLAAGAGFAGKVLHPRHLARLLAGRLGLLDRGRAAHTPPAGV